MKSTRMIELRTTMPAPAMNPIIEVAVKNAPISACAGRMPDERERDGQHDRQRRDERLEPADDEDVDQHEHRREGDAEIAEDLVRDVPLAVPLHRVLRRCRRAARVVDLERVALRHAESSTSVRFISRIA